MYKIKIENCNNILKGKLSIEERKLNIFYGINGTGKSTIAKAVEYAKEDDKLLGLQSFLTIDSVNVSMDPSVEGVYVFNEDFVNNIVFVEDEVIQNSFEVFVKTPDYTQKKTQLDKHLEDLHTIMLADADINNLQSLLEEFVGKFSHTVDGRIKKSGTYKSLLSKNNLYNIPEGLKNYEPFITNEDFNIAWIDWKNKGDDFDVDKVCPYCSEILERERQDQRKELFQKTYKKSDSKNLKELIEQIESIKEYLEPIKYDTIISYIKTDVPEDIIHEEFSKLLSEASILLKRFEQVNEFGNKQVVITDISNLDQQIDAMQLPDNFFETFGGEKTNYIIKQINDRVEKLRSEVKSLKKEMGELKGVVQATIRDSQADINEFLKTAGINYELVIDTEDESNSRTILKQCFTEDKTEVTKIRDHLSWGEKNAFALILFMYYVIRKSPDLIILDDPISSFDSNKKFAIMHRMFKNIGKTDVSFLGRTVLFLTHDFEPILDFIVVGKMNKEKIRAFYICNKRGILQSREITAESDVKLITTEYMELARSEKVNIVSRIAFLRNLCEVNGRKGVWGSVYEILSSLIHGRDIKKKTEQGNLIDMDEKNILAGTNKIREYIPDFNYEELKSKTYTKDCLKSLYMTEKNNYLKVQLFREMNEILNKNEIVMRPMDEAWYKYIDETYHIENDYLHSLDILKFDIVPEYIIDNVDKMIEKI